MRVIATFTIYGRQEDLAPIANKLTHIDISLRQIGLRRKIPALDDWCIKTPYFTIDIDLFDLNIRKYISYLNRIFVFSQIRDRIDVHSVIYIIPVYQDMVDEKFYGILEAETIAKLAEIGCALEISPESLMPEVAGTSVKEKQPDRYAKRGERNITKKFASSSILLV